MLEGRSKVREKGQSCQDKLHDLFDPFTKENQRILIIFPLSCSLDEKKIWKSYVFSDKTI